MKFIFYFFILLLIASVVFRNDQAKTISIINTPNEIAAPRTSYATLIVLNALRGKLVKEDERHYMLILMNLNKLVGISKKSQKNKNELMPLTLFIDQWKKNNNRYVGDVTGIQTDKRIGQTQFYATFHLGSPVYDLANHTLYIDAELIHPKINMVKEVFFDNVTVYVDGGAGF